MPLWQLRKSGVNEQQSFHWQINVCHQITFIHLMDKVDVVKKTAVHHFLAAIHGKIIDRRVYIIVTTKVCNTA